MNAVLLAPDPSSAVDLDVASFVVSCLSLVLTVAALVLALSAWSAEFRNQRWYSARERLLNWNQSVLVAAEDLLSLRHPLEVVNTQPAFRADLRLYARHQSRLDTSTVLFDPVYGTPADLTYEGSVLETVEYELSRVFMQWPYRQGFVWMNGEDRADFTVDDEEIRRTLLHLRERCGVFDRFVRDRQPPSRWRTARRTVLQWRDVRRFRKRNASRSYRLGASHADLWLG